MFVTNTIEWIKGRIAQYRNDREARIILANNAVYQELKGFDPNVDTADITTLGDRIENARALNAKRRFA